MLCIYVCVLYLRITHGIAIFGPYLNTCEYLSLLIPYIGSPLVHSDSLISAALRLSWASWCVLGAILYQTRTSDERFSLQYRFDMLHRHCTGCAGIHTSASVYAARKMGFSKFFNIFNVLAFMSQLYHVVSSCDMRMVQDMRDLAADRPCMASEREWDEWSERKERTEMQKIGQERKGKGRERQGKI